MAGFDRSGYFGGSFTPGDRTYEIACERYDIIVLSDCDWSEVLDGAHTFQANVTAGEILAGIRSTYNDKRKWQYLTCKFSCDSALGYEPLNGTACQSKSLPHGKSSAMSPSHLAQPVSHV